jgi:hypothetical protein
MLYYAKYLAVGIWLSFWSGAYAVFVWIALLYAPVQTSPAMFVATVAVKYAFMLLVGFFPLLLLAWLQRR